MERSLDEFIIDPRRTAVIVDFDGTLADIVADPATAKPVTHATRSLLVLSRVVREVAIVSGRPIAFLREQLPYVDEIELYGVYGLEREIDGNVMVDARILEHAPVVADAAELIKELLPELRIEQKLGAVVAVHWREHPCFEQEALALLPRLAADHGLTMHVGRMSAELRAPIPTTKATTISDIAHRPEINRILIAGDDEADYEAFVALDELVAVGELEAVFKVAVRSPEAPAGLYERASLTVNSPTELVDLFGRTAAFAMMRDYPGR